MKKIFINPGHDLNGVKDPGACALGLRECDIAYKIGQGVKKHLIVAGYGVEFLQRDGLTAIANAANKSGADLFVSIHCNCAAIDTAHGTETFYFEGSTAGQKLARCINNQIVKSLPITDRGIKTAHFAVLRLTDMPAVLVETGFINNVGDAKMLVENEVDFARAIARGISDYFQ